MRIYPKQTGFTLVEVIIAVGLFSILMVIGIGAVLNANDSRRKSETQRAANDTLAFIMEDISRNIRLGVSYRCLAGSSTPITGSAQDCISSGGAIQSSRAISFKAPYLAAVGGPADAVVVYRFIPDTGGMGYLEKSIDGGNNYFNITPSEVAFDMDQSGFTVIGAAPSTEGGDQRQPRVIVRLVGEVYDSVHDIRSSFAIQTTLSQRLLDN